MKRRDFLKTLSWGAACSLAFGPALNAAPTGKPRPNVLFIPVDDLKPLLGCYGHKQIISPNIDRLAKRATMFVNAQCQQAVSAPSRVSLLTGLYPDSTGVHDLKTLMRDKHPDAVTLPQYFRQNGYVTAGVGKTFDSRAVDENHDTASWSNGYDRWPQPFLNANYPIPRRGYQNPETQKRIGELNNLTAQRKVEGKNRWDLFKEVPGSRPAYESMDVPDDAYIDGAICKHGMDQLGKLSKGDQPFFLSVGFFKPHLPFVAPKKYWDLYDPAKIELSAFQEMPKNAAELAYQPGWELRSGYTDVPKGRLPEDYQRKLIHGYYACISYIDAQIGKLLDRLDELKLTDSTIVCLWGDHGWHLGDHSMWCKHSNFEQAVHSPLIIAAPGSGQTPGKAIGPAGFVDIFPTLCDLAGLAIPDRLQGRSLRPMLADSSAEVKQVQLSQYPRNYQGGKYMGYSLRSKRYRCTFWIPDDVVGAPDAAEQAKWIELYDYQTDPEERVNLAGEADQQQRVAEFRKLAQKEITHSRAWLPQS